MPLDRSALLIAALMGAIGTALLAAGSHTAGGLATTAGQMLLWHAPALIATVAARSAGLLDLRVSALALGLLMGGVALFALDLAVRPLLGWPRLFPMAAPIGGSLTILGWIALALAAAMAMARHRSE